ncbi:MAG: hypothetical protein AB8G77_20255 [Rhodothermales bacterium]
MRFIVCTIIAVVLHLLLGWEWTLFAGLLCGMIMPAKSWLWGGFSVATGWGVLILYNYLIASAPLLRMLDVTGQILGNLPGAVVVVVTLLIGGLLGFLGGLIGAQLVQLVPSLKLYKQQTA